MLCNEPLQCIGAEVTTAGTREERIIRRSFPFREPRPQKRNDISAQGSATHLPTFVLATHVRSRTGRHVCYL